LLHGKVVEVFGHLLKDWNHKSASDPIGKSFDITVSEETVQVLESRVFRMFGCDFVRAVVIFTNILQAVFN